MYYKSEAQTNPQGPSSGGHRVFRGGCWYYGDYNCQLTSRGSAEPEKIYDILGLRLALSK